VYVKHVVMLVIVQMVGHVVAANVNVITVNTMAKKKSKSTVNKAGNYTKPGMRKKIFNRIKAQASHGTGAGKWSARKAQALAKAYKKAGGGYK
jgi:hypothetical protein